jgi:hypothetical protein
MKIKLLVVKMIRISHVVEIASSENGRDNQQC